MKIIITFCCLVFTFISTAQLKLVPLNIKSATNQSTEIKTTFLPFWDDFSTSGDMPDAEKWNDGANVYVNDALSINTPTYKAVTFDGLQGNGTAYEIDNELAIKTDRLESHYIDLSSMTVADSVFMSFFWQAGGLSELPDESDSLYLNFYGSDDQWHQAWSINAAPENISDFFTQTVIRLDTSIYFHEQFQFEFQSIGKGNGPFDTWHLDYVYVNQNRNINDTLHLDQAITGKPTPLFGQYREIPAHIFFKDPARFATDQSIIFSNLDNRPEPIETFFQRLENVTTNEVYVSETVTRPNPNINPLTFDTLTTNYVGAIGQQLNPLDSQVILSTIAIFSGDGNLFELNLNGDTIRYPIDLKINDTIRQSFVLKNSYAYDDGIAEYAGGINESGGFLAMRYGLAEPDTLTHLDIHFPNIDPNSTDRSVEIKVWSDVERDRVLISQPYTITPNSRLNEFKRIKLNRSLLVKDTIFIGFEQLDNDYIAIGFDNTNPEASGEIWSNTTGTWERNVRLRGVFMMRPVFQFDSTFVLNNRPTLPSMVPYPNPSKGIVNFNNEVEEIAVYSLSGSLVFHGQRRKSFDMTFLDDGIYLLKISADAQIQTTKLIIRQ